MVVDQFVAVSQCAGYRDHGDTYRLCALRYSYWSLVVQGLEVQGPLSGDD